MITTEANDSNDMAKPFLLFIGSALINNFNEIMGAAAFTLSVVYSAVKIYKEIKRKK